MDATQVPSRRHRALLETLQALSREELEMFAFGSAVSCQQLLDLLSSKEGKAIGCSLPIHLTGQEAADRVEAVSRKVYIGVEDRAALILSRN